MTRFPEPRSVRRLLKRQQERQRLEERLAEKMRTQGYRDPEDDRRKAERRRESLTPDQLDRRLRELGISEDRRRGQRRSGTDRRRG